MVDERLNEEADEKLDEGMEFVSSQTPWYSPLGMFGKFFSKFFARGKYKDQEAIDSADQQKDPIRPRKPLDGDAVQQTDVIKPTATASTLAGSRSNSLTLPQQEYDRKRRYREYEDMDNYPEIGSAFDVYADDCSQENLDGSKWDVISEDEMIKEEVKDLFENIELKKYLWDIVRNTVKFGDNFLELVVNLNDVKKGIQKIKVLNPSFLYRVEDEFGYLQSFIQEIPAKDDWQAYGGLGIQAKDNNLIPLDAAQIVHFRLWTSDPMHYPYGKSIAAPGRTIYKSLKMMEDAMLIYRLSRAPERRIFYIDTGSLPTTKAEAHIKAQMDKFKKSKVFNKTTGNIEETYNAIAADEDFYIAVNGKGSGTKIETLPGADNLGEVDDVKYFRDKLLAALKVPKDYIVEKDQAPDRKANLSQLDVKFARVITRIQQSVEIGLELIAQRHLVLKGFPLNRVKKLKIKLPAPSDMARKRQLDLDEQKARVVQAVKGLGLFPVEYLYKEYYQFNDNEIKKIKDTLKKEQKDPVLQQMAAGMGGMDPMMGGGMPPPEEPGMENGLGEPAENSPPTQREEELYTPDIEKLYEAGLSPEARQVILSMKYDNGN